MPQRRRQWAKPAVLGRKRVSRAAIDAENGMANSLNEQAVPSCLYLYEYGKLWKESI